MQADFFILFFIFYHCLGRHSVKPLGTAGAKNRISLGYPSPYRVIQQTFQLPHILLRYISVTGKTAADVSVCAHVLKLQAQTAGQFCDKILYICYHGCGRKGSAVQQLVYHKFVGINGVKIHRSHISVLIQCK